MQRTAAVRTIRRTCARHTQSISGSNHNVNRLPAFARNPQAVGFLAYLHELNSPFVNDRPEVGTSASASASSMGDNAREYAVKPLAVGSYQKAESSPPRSKHRPNSGRRAVGRTNSGGVALQEALEDSIRHRMSANAAQHKLTEWRRAGRILGDVERALSRKLKTYMQSPSPGDGDGEDNAIEAFLFERVGQLQRTLRGLSDDHYRVAATGRSKTGENLLIRFIQGQTRLLFFLHTLALLRAGNAMQVKLSGVEASLRKAMHVYHPHVRSGVDVWHMFWAAMALPGEEPVALPAETQSLVLRLPPGQHNNIDVSQPFTPLRAEAWCLVQWVRMQDIYGKNTRRPHTLTFSQRMSVLRACMSAHVDDDQPHFNHTMERYASSHHPISIAEARRPTLRVPFPMGKAFTEQFISDLLQSTEPTNREDKKKGETTAQSDGDTSVVSSVHVRDIATLCAAVLFYEVRTNDALRVLVAAAPQCAEYCELLSGHDICCLMIAYATLKYDGVLRRNINGGDNFYVILGTRVGQLGDRLRREDIAKVLRALDMVDALGLIDVDCLRASLESSLRMRGLHRRVMFDTA